MNAHFHILKVKYHKGYFTNDSIDLVQVLRHSSLRPRTKEQIQSLYKHCEVLEVRRLEVEGENATTQEFYNGEFDGCKYSIIK